MIEYARALYQGWCQGKSLQEIQQNHSDFICVCSKLLHRDKEDITVQLHNEHWFLREIDGVLYEDRTHTTSATNSCAGHYTNNTIENSQ